MTVIITFDDGERLDVFKLTQQEFNLLDLDKLNAAGEISINFVEDIEFSTAEEIISYLNL